MITMVLSEAQAYLTRQGLLTDEVRERIKNETIGKQHPRFTACKCLPYKLKRDLNFALDDAAKHEINYFNSDDALEKYGDVEAKEMLLDWLVGIQSASNVIEGLDDCETLEELEVLWDVEETLTR